MSERRIKCSKLGEELVGLDKPPFPGKVGQLIFENVSKQAWDQWKNDIQIKLLNEYRLNMWDIDDYRVALAQMLQFFNLESPEEL
jgi:Fe-S cluster biosynthesis and repair protein YggX